MVITLWAILWLIIFAIRFIAALAWVTWQLGRWLFTRRRPVAVTVPQARYSNRR